MSELKIRPNHSMLDMYGLEKPFLKIYTNTRRHYSVINGDRQRISRQPNPSNKPSEVLH